MAERRMFAKTIVESDAFMSLSLKAQNLYFQLGMEADDDGILNNALTICRSLGFRKDVLDELLSKRFLLDLGDGITVIKHWLINNRIQKDRYKESVYREKMQKLSIKCDRSYTDTDTKCTQNGQQMDTQVSIGKDSIGKDNDDDILQINARLLESGVNRDLIDQAMHYSLKYDDVDKNLYLKIIDVLENDDINDKGAYIYRMVTNESNREIYS